MADVNREIILKVTPDTSGVGGAVNEVNNELKKIKVDDSSVKSFKQQLKEAKEAALALQQAGKENTIEYQKAVEAIADLKDQQDVLNRATASYDPGNKFIALNKVASLGAQSIQGLTGGMNLLGISSKTAEEQIAKLQSIGSIISLIDAWGDAGDFLVPFLQRLGLMKVATTEQTVAQELAVASTTAQNVATTTALELTAAEIALEEAKIAVKQAQNVVSNETLNTSDFLTEAEETLANALHARDAATSNLTKAQNANNAATKASATANDLASEATKGATTSTKGLGTAFKLLGIGLIVAGISYLIVNFEKIKDVVLKFIPALKVVGDLFGKIVDWVTDFVGLTSDATRALDALTKAQERSGRMIDYQIQRLEAQGGKEKEIHRLRIKRADDELNVLRKKLEVEGKLNEEDLKLFRDLKVKKEVEDLKETKRINDNNKKEADANKAKHDKLLAQQKALADKVKAQNEAEMKTVNENLKNAQKAIDDSFRTDLQKAENNIRLKYKTEIDLANKHNQDTLVLESARDAELNAVRIKSAEDSAKKLQEAKEKLQKEADEKIKAKLEADLLNAKNNNIVSEDDSPEKAFEKITAISNAELNAELEAFERRKIQLAGQNEELANLEAQYANKVIEITTSASEAKKKVEDKEKEAKINNINAVGDAASMASSVFAEHTVAYKALASAGALIDGYGAINKVLNTPSTLPEPFGSIAKGISAAAIGVNAMKQVKAINAVKVEGAKGTATRAANSISIPSAPTIVARESNGNSTQDVNVVNQNNEPIVAKAYIVDKELKDNQSKSNFFNNLQQI